MSLTSLTYRELVIVLRDLCGGSIGFDHNRDARTAKKEDMLRYIATTFEDSAIIAAVERLSPHAYKASDDRPSNHDASAIGQQIGQLLASVTAKAAIDADQVKAIVEQCLSERLTNAVRVVVRRYDSETAKDLGVQHLRFPTLLKACQARTYDGHRLNLWLKGPAGSGKTTAAKNVAKALDLPFWFNGAIDTQYALMGFVDATGNYHKTAFRDAFENGGVYLFDEVDSSSPSAVLAFNAALANGVCVFPDKIVERHKDCVILAGANTAGVGSNAEYVGRFKQDAAFLDRFVFIDWPTDSNLERAIAGNADFVDRVQAVRSNVAHRGIKNHLITPRASVFGVALLAAGLEQAEVEGMVLRKGLADDSWSQII